jgi:hypothetical protein
MGYLYQQPAGPEGAVASDYDINQQQDGINQQQDIINQQLLDQLQHLHARLNEVYAWIVNHEQIHAS